MPPLERGPGGQAGHLRPPVLGEQHVPWAERVVLHAAPPGGGERPGDLDADGARLVGLERTVRQALDQARARRPLADHLEGTVRGVDHVVDVEEAGVGHTGRRPGGDGHGFTPRVVRVHEDHPDVAVQDRVAGPPGRPAGPSVTRSSRR